MSVYTQRRAVSLHPMARRREKLGQDGADDRLIPVQDLCLLSQFGEWCGVTPNHMRVWKHRSKTVFPKPVFEEGPVRLYLFSDLCVWYDVEKLGIAPG